MVQGLLILILVGQVPTGETRGAVFANENGRAGGKLFDILRTVKRTPAGWSAAMEFRDASGAIAVRERVELDRRLRPVVYHRRQHQTGGRGSIRIEGSSISYEWTNAEGQTRRNVESYEGDVMIGPMMSSYFVHHWSRIRAGEEMAFRIMVPDRQTSYAFEFQKVDDVIIEGERLAKCELRMSGLLGLFVGDMIFYLDAETGELIRYSGLVLPKTRDGDEWTNVKGIVRYQRHDLATR
ncbi:MAG: hypothetical protein AAFN74_01680 [Myxococcota bacterium]